MKESQFKINGFSIFYRSDKFAVALTGVGADSRMVVVPKQVGDEVVLSDLLVSSRTLTVDECDTMIEILNELKRNLPQ